MKLPTLLCLFLALAASVAAQKPKAPPPPPLPATPEETAAINAAADRVRLALPAHLVFVGDSLTAMMPDDNYVAIIRQALQRRLGADVRVTNAGVNGDTITRVQARLDRDVLQLSPKPTHVFLFLGHNDSKLSWESRYQASFVSPEDYERQYREVIVALQEKLGARVTVISATASAYELTKAIADAKARTNTAHNLFGQPAALERFNAIARRVASGRGAGYLDVYTPTRTFPRPADLYRKDGVHVNERGNRLLAVEILRYLASPAAP